MTRLRGRAAGVLFVAALITALPSARGFAQDSEAEGRRRFNAGKELYAQGKYLEAAREFEAGYAVAPRPLFLMNIAHAYRRAQELQKAKDAYESLLKLEPNLPQRTEVEGYIRSIDDALQASEPTRPPGSSPALVDPGSEQRTVTLPAAAPPVIDEPKDSPPPVTLSRPSLRATTDDEPDARAKPSVLRRPWFWVLAGAVVAGSVAVAVVALRPSSNCPGGAYCISEP